jgi:hypothetical protein
MPGPHNDPKPNEKAGKALLKSMGDVIDIDSETLRDTARLFQSRAEHLSTTKTTVDGINSSADSESETFISQHAPDGIYSTAVSSLKSIGTKFGSEIDKAKAKLETDAGALMWIAEHHDSTETENEHSMQDIPDEVQAPGTPGVPATPATTGPVYTV